VRRFFLADKGEARRFYQADRRRGEVLASILDERERVLPG
jgi:hypothetical protein